MLPYVHYVPVKADLSDLKAKYEWAESHAEVVKRIAANGSELMRHIGTVDGFGEMFHEDFIEPIQRVLDVYVPVKESHPGMTWREVMKEEGGKHAELVIRERCVGKSGNRKEDCMGFDPKESLL